MTYHIDVQHACATPNPFTDDKIRHWVNTTLKSQCETAELTVRFVESSEITLLNHTYRHQNKPTNVLAFPADIPDNIELDYPLLGDVIICPSVLLEESIELEQPLEAHWAHIVVHGVLHLFGYDHINTEDAIKMQSLEIELLATLGFENPYQEHDEENTID